MASSDVLGCTRVIIFLLLGRLHAVQKGIKIDSKGKESKAFLLQLMDQLEKVWLVLNLCLKVSSLHVVMWLHVLF